MSPYLPSGIGVVDAVVVAVVDFVVADVGFADVVVVVVVDVVVAVVVDFVVADIGLRMLLLLVVLDDSGGGNVNNTRVKVQVI